jgi:hypothetical protein
MFPLLKVLAVVALIVLGGFVVYRVGCYVDHLLHPGCELVRLAGVSLFATFAIGFGALGGIWPPPGPSDSVSGR